jgi:hypothetical protein
MRRELRYALRCGTRRRDLWRDHVWRVGSRGVCSGLADVSPNHARDHLQIARPTPGCRAYPPPRSSNTSRVFPRKFPRENLGTCCFGWKMSGYMAASGLVVRGDFFGFRLLWGSAKFFGVYGPSRPIQTAIIRVRLAAWRPARLLGGARQGFGLATDRVRYEAPNAGADALQTSQGSSLEQ